MLFVRDDLAAKRALAFHHAENNCLVLEIGTFATPALELAADKGLVHFNVTRQRAGVLRFCPSCHQIAQLMADAPRAFISYAKLAL